jgi:hypothetical protein
MPHRCFAVRSVVADRLTKKNGVCSSCRPHRSLRRCALVCRRHSTHHSLSSPYLFIHSLTHQANSPESAAGAAPFEWEAGATPGSGTTTGGGGGDELPYRLQQDADMYSAENLMRRKALKKSELIKRQINRMWMLLEKSRRGRLSKHAYTSFMLVRNARIRIVRAGDRRCASTSTATLSLSLSLTHTHSHMPHRHLSPF